MMTGSKFATLAFAALAVAGTSLAITGDAFARGGMGGHGGPGGLGGIGGHAGMGGINTTTSFNGLNSFHSTNGLKTRTGTKIVTVRHDGLRWRHRHPFFFGGASYFDYSPCYYVTKLGRVLKVCPVEY